jgi:D-serine deaminase-like pyridoxal phosphate-dependent protein
VNIVSNDRWYPVINSAEVMTPALLIYPDRVETNIRHMIKIAGSPELVRPHVKTHKISQIIKLKIKYGISKFKCSTIAEAEMVAQCGGKDIMLAMQPVGPNIERLFKLQERYPGSGFSVNVDSEDIVKKISSMAAMVNQSMDLWLDINNGMDRTGISPGDEAFRLYQVMSSLPYIQLRGVHVYDGHIHDKDINERKKSCNRDFKPVISLIDTLRKAGLKVPAIVAGGTPTFPIHAGHKDIETSPGTCILWDSGYDENYPDLGFIPAAVLMMQIISKPGKNLLCLDLGHKSVGAEMPHPRIRLLDIPHCSFVNHSEEHLVIETSESERWYLGDILYGIPWHICPTVPRYPYAHVIRNNKFTETWAIDARDRMLTV